MRSKGPRLFVLVAASLRFYCTVRVADVDCDNVPDVAVTVNWEVPGGVPFMPLAQPARTPPLMRSSANGTRAA